MISLNSSGGQIYRPSNPSGISDDGRYVLFVSEAPDVVIGDTNSASDVFLRDRRAATTTRVSVASGGSEANSASGGAFFGGDGRYVFFTSTASNLVPGDTNNDEDIFVHDRKRSVTQRVSMSSTGGQISGPSFGPSLSADGRYLSFSSTASNVVPGDTNESADIFVRDLKTAKVSRVSEGINGAQADGYSLGSAISRNGRFVAFTSSASNLVSNDTNDNWDVFVYDRRTEATTLVSVAVDGSPADSGSWYPPSISADGRYIAFPSAASNLVADDTNGSQDVFLYDRQRRSTSLVSKADDSTQGNGNSYSASISADGRYVAIVSFASNLVAGDLNWYQDVFVHDRQRATITLASVSYQGTQGNGDSVGPAISSNGRYIAFESQASNLVPVDRNSTNDVFIRSL